MVDVNAHKTFLEIQYGENDCHHFKNTEILFNILISLLTNQTKCRGNLKQIFLKAPFRMRQLRMLAKKNN